MEEVIHIDGLGLGPSPRIEIQPGATWGEALKQLGATVEVKHVPYGEHERTISAEAAAFLRDYEYEDPSSALAIYWRYHSLEAVEFDTVEEAERFLEGGAEYGSLAGEAVVDSDGQVTVLP